MQRALPFFALGLIAVTGWLTATPTTAATAPATPTDESGSVRVTAQLERTHLIAGQAGEAYARIVLEGIEAPASDDRLPVSLTLVIDRSGSMRGEKMVRAREAALAALDSLQSGDRVNVIAFSSGSDALIEGARVGSADLFGARRAISELKASGGTNMNAALRDADRAASSIAGEDRVNRVLLLSDGQPDSESGLAELVKTMARKGVHTTTLGVGRDYNEDLMSRLADAGLGNYYFVERAAQLATIFEKELESLATVVAKEAVITVDTKSGVEVLEVIGWDASRGSRTTAIPVGDIFASKKADVLLKVRIPAHDVGEAGLVDVKVSYHDALAGSARRVAMPLQASFTTNRALADASVVPVVAQKREEVLTARALERAAEAYSRGDKDDAKQIVAEQKARVQSFAATAGASFAPAAAEMDGAMDELEEEVATKDIEVVRKKAKQKARDYRR
jgi:Ca-activated chloride channel family protein